MLPPLVLGLAILLLLFSIGTITWLYLRLVRSVAFADRKGSYDLFSVQTQILAVETGTKVKCVSGPSSLCEDPVLQTEEASGGLLPMPAPMAAQTNDALLKLSRSECEHSKSSTSLEGDDSAYSSFFDDGAKLRLFFRKESVQSDELSPNETVADSGADATVIVKAESDTAIHVGKDLKSELALAEEVPCLSQPCLKPSETVLKNETATVFESPDSEYDDNSDLQCLTLGTVRNTSSLCSSQCSLDAANSEESFLETSSKNEAVRRLPRKLHDETYRQYIESIRLKNQGRLFFGAGTLNNKKPTNL